MGARERTPTALQRTETPSTHIPKPPANYPAPQDFWTTRCPRCPAALDALNTFAGGWDQKERPTLFLSICCGSGTQDDEEAGQDAVEEGEWHELTHAYVTADTKQVCKDAFGFAAVPYYVISSKDGRVRFTGGTSEFSARVIQSTLNDATRPVDGPPTAYNRESTHSVSLSGAAACEYEDNTPATLDEAPLVGSTATGSRAAPETHTLVLDADF